MCDMMSSTMSNRQLAAVSITKHGTALVRDLQTKLSNIDVYYHEKFTYGDEQQRKINLFNGSVRLILPELFQRYDGLIFVISLGAIVRMIAPLLQDKKTDPAVLVIDDYGEHVISVLSGHLGGANELTRKIASIINAKPVITTASDVQKTIAVDLLGREIGWTWENEDKLTPVSASVVNEEKVAVIQESGEKNWWKYEHSLPKNISVFPTVTKALQSKFDAALVITHRLLKQEEEHILTNGVLFRPKVIVIGMGCNRGTSAMEIEEVIQETLIDLNFSINSVKALCTIDLKKDEEGLLEVTRKYGWDFIYYCPKELNEMEILEPSETVFKYTGAYGVSEPAVKRYLGKNKLALVKKKSGNCTISIGIIEH